MLPQNEVNEKDEVESICKKPKCTSSSSVALIETSKSKSTNSVIHYFNVSVANYPEICTRAGYQVRHVIQKDMQLLRQNTPDDRERGAYPCRCKVAVTLSDVHKVLSVYDCHFFPHANVDMYRIRFFSRSLIFRISDAFRRSSLIHTDDHSSDSKIVMALKQAIMKNKKSDEVLQTEDYALRTLIHVCEFIICKVEGLREETTDIREISRRCQLRDGTRGVRDIEALILDTVEWSVFGGLTVAAFEQELRKKHEQYPRYIDATYSKHHDRINATFVRVQRCKRDGIHALLKSAGGSFSAGMSTIMCRSNDIHDSR